MNRQKGFSSLEVVLAAAVFVVFATAMVTLSLQSFSANRSGGEITVANQFASEGIEKIRSIRNQTPGYMTSSYTGGIGISNGTSILNNSTNNIFDKYTRVINISAVKRDCNGNIVTNGSGDATMIKTTSTVTWAFNSSQNNSLNLTSYLTTWRNPFGPDSGGIMAYGDQSATPDGISYRLFDNASGTWSNALPLADINPNSTNQILHAIRVFSSSTRNEKVTISRHFDGTAQYIYAETYNGISWCPTLLTSFNSQSFLDVRNFDAAYLNNGDFMVVYSDNTTIPKYRIWNGASWNPPANSPGIPLQDLNGNGHGGIPLYIVTRTRPQTNEVMAAFLDNNKDINTEYFVYNGNNYDTASWSLDNPAHSTNSRSTNEVIDFTWNKVSPNLGNLFYQSPNNSKKVAFDSYDASQKHWNGGINNPTSQGTINPLHSSSQPNSNNIFVCDQDTSNNIFCFETLSSSNPAWLSKPANNKLTGTTAVGRQRTFDFNFEQLSGSWGIAVYADTSNNQNVPKLKKYNVVTNSFDSNPTFLPTLKAPLESVTIKPQNLNNDMMILMGDNGTPPNVYTILWDGTNNQIYTQPLGKALLNQGSSGSSPTEYWYDFTWNQF